MVTKLRTIIALAVVGLVIGLAFVATSGDAQAKPKQFQAVNMIVAGQPGNFVPGAATLIRSRNGIKYRIYTTGLNDGDAYTVWIVIFNRPEHCDGSPDGLERCIGPDLGNPDVKGSIVYGGGYVAGANGNGNFHGSLEKGNPPAGIEVNVPAGMANGLKHPMRADIHLVVRTHGDTIAGQAVQQFSTFEDGCAVCANVQAGVFEGSGVGNDDDD